MAEKGGKGYSAPTKSSLKSTPMQNGKDDSSSKSQKGRRVQFNGEGSPEHNFNFASSKADGKSAASMGKGGKGGKSAGKTTAAKEARPPELKIEQELPKNVKCMIDAEAATILQGIQEQMVFLSADPSIKLPLSFDKGLLYAKAGCQYENPQSARESLEVLTNYGVSNSEICVIGNVCPETVDEALALVPSLKAKKEELSEPLREALDELQHLKKES